VRPPRRAPRYGYTMDHTPQADSVQSNFTKRCDLFSRCRQNFSARRRARQYTVVRGESRGSGPSENTCVPFP